MKKIMMLLSLTMAVAAQAGDAPRFSAFSVGNELYVTLLGDGCNELEGTLKVSDTCKEDRAYKNLAYTCEAHLYVATTMMYCEDRNRLPQVLTINLDKSNVAKEAKLLILAGHGIVDEGPRVDVILDR